MEIEGTSASGSSESQDGLQSSEANQSKTLIKDEWLLCISEKFSKHAINLIRLCFCISIGLFLASNMTAQNYKQISSNIIASSDILLDKSLRGVFPPLEGKVYQIYGVWSLAIVTEIQGTSRRFSEYSLNFKTNGEVQLTHSKCKGDIKLKWHIFYFNMSIKKIIPGDDDDMEIPNEEEDVKCIYQKGEFQEILLNVSIWTVHANILYIISEMDTTGVNKSKMLIFKKQQ